MALVTFTDSAGTRWHVWNVTREGFSALKSDYLGSEYHNGWLCFETEDGRDRRRLGTFPDDWATLGPVRLEALLGTASGATTRHQSVTRQIGERVQEFLQDAAPPRDER